ncbi:MAG: Ni/Fe hydrogenase subunit alpha [Hydrogenothermaceae bacterium]|nr:Ni/Fe hydrogenase subunit alpha [Hydrogenothermaceae bacterium]
MEIKLNPLTRVEGEGRVIVSIKDGKVNDVFLNIFEPPRFFEGILVGKNYDVAPDITARICGICPIAYQMSSVQAFESAFGIDIPKEIEDLRRLFYYGEWIQSHTLHIFFLHLPDFFNLPSIFEVNKINPEIVKIAFNLKRFSSKLIEIIGGRVSHPVTAAVGGFYKTPEENNLKEILKDINLVLEDTVKAIDYVSRLNFPDYSIENVLFVSLKDGDNYPILKGDIYSSDGLTIKKEEFLEYFNEYEVPHSTAKFSVKKDGKHYIVGPIARFNNTFDKLLPLVRETAKKYSITPPIYNPYRSILIRLIEILDCLYRSKSLIENYRRIDKATVDFEVKAGVGVGVSEAPRGILWHRYVISETGRILEANIIPPTSQNQYIMESDVKRKLLEVKEDEIRERVLEAEKSIRNYDPCISCATHFLKVDKLYLNNR